MHLISVLLPEPDGPQITTTSPLAMLIEQLSRTWNGPYHFADVLELDHRAYLRRSRLASRDALKQMTRKTRATNMIELGRPIVAAGHDVGRGQEVAQAHDVHERGVLQHDDRLRQQDRDHVAHGLRQDHVAHRLHAW